MKDKVPHYDTPQPQGAEMVCGCCANEIINEHHDVIFAICDECGIEGKQWHWGDIAPSAEVVMIFIHKDVKQMIMRNFFPDWPEYHRSAGASQQTGRCGCGSPFADHVPGGQHCRKP
jgi:hypothetical protein